MQLPAFSAFALNLLLLCTAPVVLAQAAPRPATTQPGRPEIRAYVQQHVLPAVRRQRQQLETRLSTSDKAQLAVYRAQFHDLRQRGQALRAETQPNGATARPVLTEAQQQQRQQLRTETRALLLRVSELARPHEADIARLAQELKPQQEKWAADIQALTSQSANPEPTARHSRRSPGQRLLRPVAFLLLEPVAAPAAPTAPAGAETRVYPNPTATATQLDYELPKAGPVTVELLDGRGNTLRTVQPETKQEKGSHTLPLDVADLPVGTYFFKITTRAGAETRRFVKE
ncbi:T9SS type A sorting domain-containing protein [Hymenobacter perfusus]|uniref:T9SS C-terminal target domain-containing protein n=1 Tax=Hymenobacter perfusus TaxID=1236770 RepID=A0A428K7M0_9BACT|nr:T9SS type A sorting domain-containing protein [Hymenobacter perfusus]RSK42405.1 T9SS C-terminal target domain-containing protein [Hymenobacter perfusus]